MESNKGLILGQRETDYKLGSSPIKKTVLVPNGDWKQWAPEHEIQAYRFLDTMSCVSYSALDSIEYSFIYHLNNGLVRPEDVKWLQEKGYFLNGYINFSERFTAILGETTKNGAYQYMVGDAIRKFGLIPQTMFQMSDDIKTFEEYIDKSKITPEMYALGKEFIERFPIGYEWAGDVREGLKYGAVQVCVYYADGTNLLCPPQRPIHAVTAVKHTNEYIEIDDSYSRQFKQYCHQAIWSPMLYTVNFKTMNEFIKNNDLKWVRNKQTGAFGRVMRGELKTFQTTDRACLALLDDKVRENGVQIDDALWISLPKNNF